MSFPWIQNRSNRTSKRKGLSLVVVALALCVLLWFAVRTLRELMMLGYVDSAIGRVRAVVAAETDFAKAHPEIGYTCTISQLPQNQLVARLGTGAIDNGYKFEVVGCRGLAPQKQNSMYHVTARPLHSGLPAFCSDPSGVLRSDDTGSVEKCLTTGVPGGS